MCIYTLYIYIIYTCIHLSHDLLLARKGISHDYPLRHPRYYFNIGLRPIYRLVMLYPYFRIIMLMNINSNSAFSSNCICIITESIRCLIRHPPIRQIDKQTDRQTKKWTNTQIDKQTDRHTDR